MPSTAKESKTDKTPVRARISQSDVPAFSLDQALRIPKAIFENYGGDPTRPLSVAEAMNLSPTSSNFRQLTGASIAYGLTEGGYNANEVSITKLGQQILSPLEEGEDTLAKKTAFLKPRIISDFLQKYDGYAVPKEGIAQNVLVDMGVPRDRSEQILSVIIEDASSLGLISEIKGKKYINLDAPEQYINDTQNVESITNESEDDFTTDEKPELQISPKPSVAEDDHRAKRVYITHGKNMELVDPIKKLLAFGELEPVVSVEKQSVSEPVPDKVMKDMRSCGAAIIHVDKDTKLIDSDANEQIILNPNVLIEIGAAMALYGRRFILLVREGVKLPSNLQGLYEVRYSDEKLDSDSTIRLLEAIKSLKSTEALPT